MDPFDYFDDIHCISLADAAGRWEEMEARFRMLGIAHRLRYFPAVSTPGDHQIGRALSHRRIVQEASERGLRTVLVFEDDALFLNRIHAVLAEAVRELAGIEWTLCYLGGGPLGGKLEPEPGCRRLDRAIDIVGTHAIAYSDRVFARLLGDLPGDVPGMAGWIKQHRSLGQYLRRIGRAVLLHPPVATQPRLLPSENPADQFSFTI